MQLALIFFTDFRVPSAFIQPIASDEVAAALVDVALGVPVNGILDLAGPERFRFDEIIAQFLSATQDARQVVTDKRALLWRSTG